MRGGAGTIGRRLGPVGPGAGLERQRPRHRQLAVGPGPGVVAADLAGDVEPGRVAVSRRPQVPAVRVPALVVLPLAERGVFPSDASTIHDALGTPDGDEQLMARRSAQARVQSQPRRPRPRRWPVRRR